jgi:hypothetical protein
VVGCGLPLESVVYGPDEGVLYRRGEGHDGDCLSVTCRPSLKLIECS